VQLFGEGDLDAVLRDRMRQLMNQVQSEDKDYLLNVNETEFVRHLVEKYRVEPLVVHVEQLSATEREENIPAERVNDFRYLPQSGRVYRKQVIRYHIPFSGTPELLKFKPSSGLIWSANVGEQSGEILHDVVVWDDDAGRMNRDREQFLKNLKIRVGDSTSEVQGFNQRLEGEVTRIVQSRKAELWKNLSLVESLGVPLKKSSNVPSTFAVPPPQKRSIAPNALEAFRWTAASGMVGLGVPVGYSTSLLNRVSADGSLGVGLASGPRQQAEYWTPSTGWVGLGFLRGGSSSEALSVSANGSVIVGNGDVNGFGQAFRWTQTTGMVGLGNLPGGGFNSSANGVSPDGSAVVGVASGPAGQEAFRWTQSAGMVGLGLLNGNGPTIANAVSNGGSIVVGNASTGGSSTEAFIWDSIHGMRGLEDVLIADFGLNLAGWSLTDATDISADGRTIVGEGFNPDGNHEGWIANLTPTPAPPTLVMSFILAGSYCVGWCCKRLTSRKRWASDVKSANVLSCLNGSGL